MNHCSCDNCGIIFDLDVVEPWPADKKPDNFKKEVNIYNCPLCDHEIYHLPDTEEE